MSYARRHLVDRIILILESKPRRSLAELGRELGVSPRKIQNAINAVTAKKFSDLQHSALFEKIESLIKIAPKVLIKELAYEVGYKSPSAFARAVRRVCGISPAEVRSRLARQPPTKKAQA